MKKIFTAALLSLLSLGSLFAEPLQDDREFFSCTNYDEQGNIVYYKDYTGYEYWNEYTQDGKLLKSSDCYGFVEVYTYNANGLLENKILKTIDEIPEKSLSEVTEYVYDQAGNCILEKGPYYTISHSYDEKGRRCHTVNANGVDVYCAYDSKDNLIQQTGDTWVENYEYDKKGNLIFVSYTDEESGETFTTSYVYDKKGNMTFMRMNNGFEVVCSYDKKGNITFSRTIDGECKFYEYLFDKKGRIIQMTIYIAQDEAVG